VTEPEGMSLEDAVQTGVAYLKDQGAIPRHASIVSVAMEGNEAIGWHVEVTMSEGPPVKFDISPPGMAPTAH